jgi:hypothetical protein
MRRDTQHAASIPADSRDRREPNKSEIMPPDPHHSPKSRTETREQQSEFVSSDRSPPKSKSIIQYIHHSQDPG